MYSVCGLNVMILFPVRAFQSPTLFFPSMLAIVSPSGENFTEFTPLPVSVRIFVFFPVRAFQSWMVLSAPPAYDCFSIWRIRN